MFTRKFAIRRSEFGRGDAFGEALAPGRRAAAADAHADAVGRRGADDLQRVSVRARVPRRTGHVHDAVCEQVVSQSGRRARALPDGRAAAHAGLRARAPDQAACLSDTNGTQSAARALGVGRVAVRYAD